MKMLLLWDSQIRGVVLNGSYVLYSLWRHPQLDLLRNKLIHKETLINQLARIRDVEIGNSGEIYLLLEHTAGSKIVRLFPAEKEQRAKDQP